MTKSQLHILAIRMNDLYTDIHNLKNVKLPDLYEQWDSIREKALHLSIALDEYDEYTAEDFGAGIKLED